MRTSDNGSGRTSVAKANAPKHGKTTIGRNSRSLTSDNYHKNRKIRVSVLVANEPDEVIKLKELAIATTVRAAFERSLLLRLKNMSQAGE